MRDFFFFILYFFFNATATTEIYTLSLHDALPIWAQDAWGRYWKWDALETSSFLTWLAMGASIHARIAYRIPIRVGAVAIILIFVIAFLTYFSTPFISEAAHKGVI